MMERNEDLRLKDPAVVVTDAYKCYTRNTAVLNGLNMRVQEGTIYGLLGPSGCGKTTLLSCIVGRSNLDSGNIKLGIKLRSELGYMPQELGLFTDFSIEETLKYYGCIFGIFGTNLQNKIQELLKMLDLPEKTRVLKELSGGQQRRVSFCVALLHNPKLLILDEPTCGVDPILSNNIWQRLLHMSTVEKKTIIITTHYIEEARAANTIGLMRGGVLLAEEEPNALINQHNCETLEGVFLRLSHMQTNTTEYSQYEDDNPKVIKKLNKTLKKSSAPLSVSENFQPRRVRAQFYKSLFWMKRNIPIMLFLIGLPFVQCTIFNLTVGLDPIGLKVGVVNDELNDWRSDCYKYNKSCGESPISCQFLTKLVDKDVSLVKYDTIEEAQSAVRKNDVWGMIHFGPNYTENLLERVTLNTYASNESINLSDANVWMDMSNQYIGNMIKWDIFSGYIEFMENLFYTCGWPRKAGGIPVNFQDAVYGTNDPSFTHFAVPAVLQLFEFYLPMMFTVGAIIMEKRDGTLERSLVSGITLRETLTAHITVQFILLTVQTIIMLLVLFVMFDTPLKGSFLLCILLLFLIGTNGMCYGFFVSTFCESETAAAYMGIGSFFPFSLLSGMLWPLEGMHYLLRSIGVVLPLTLTTESMRAIMMRSWPITHPVVYKGFLSVVGWIAIFSFCTFVLVRLQNGIRGK